MPHRDDPPQEVIDENEPVGLEDIAIAALNESINAGMSEDPICRAIRDVLHLQKLRIADYVASFGEVGIAAYIRADKFNEGRVYGSEV